MASQRVQLCLLDDGQILFYPLCWCYIDIITSDKLQLDASAASSSYHLYQSVPTLPSVITAASSSSLERTSNVSSNAGSRAIFSERICIAFSLTKKVSWPCCSRARQLLTSCFCRSCTCYAVPAHAEETHPQKYELHLYVCAENM